MLLTADTQSLKGAHFVRCAHLPFPYLQYQKDKLESPKESAVSWMISPVGVVILWLMFCREIILGYYTNYIPNPLCPQCGRLCRTCVPTCREGWGLEKMAGKLYYPREGNWKLPKGESSTEE